MRSRLPLLLGLALAGCSYRVDDCKQPAVDFTIDEEIDEGLAERLVLEHEVIAPSDLECDLVCATLYLDRHPKGDTRSIDTCELTIDGGFTGDPEAILGTVNCSGRGIPQFCVDA